MPHPDAEHSLRIQLATALRELEEEKAMAGRLGDRAWAAEAERDELMEALAAANARADAAQSRIADLTADATGHMHRCAKVNRKWECASGCAIPALAAARRECDGLREWLERVDAYFHGTLVVDEAHFRSEIRAALAAPAAASGEEGT